MMPAVNNYFKCYRNQVFPFNDQSNLSTSRALGLVTVLARGGPITVWKCFLGMPDFLRVVGENFGDTSVESPEHGAECGAEHGVNGTFG